MIRVNDKTLNTSVILPELRSRNFLPASTVAVFASGSLVRGWGNATSDVDVHIVAAAQPESATGETIHVALEPSFLKHEGAFVAGRRWDIEYWSVPQVNQLLAKV